MITFVIIMLLISPVLSTPLVLFGLCTDKKHKMGYLVMLSLILATIAYNYVPNATNDLYHHYKLLEWFRNGTIETLKSHYYYDKLPFYSIYFYIISKIGSNGLLPFITTLAGYCSVFFIMKKIAITEKIEYSNLIITLIFFLCTFSFIGYVSGIRNMLAFSLFALVAFNELYGDKSKLNKAFAWVIYAALCFFHSSIIVLFLIRIVVEVCYRKKFVGSVLMLSWATFWINMQNWLTPYTNYKLIALIVGQLDYYQVSPYTNVYTYMIRFIALTTVIVAFYYIKRTEPDILKKHQKYYVFCEYILLFTVGSCMYYDLFVRFCNLSIIVGVSIIPVFLNIRKNNFVKFMSVVILSVSIFSLVFYFMIAYRHMEFTGGILGLLSENIFTIR